MNKRQLGSLTAVCTPFWEAWKQNFYMRSHIPKKCEPLKCFPQRAYLRTIVKVRRGFYLPEKCDFGTICCSLISARWSICCEFHQCITFYIMPLDLQTPPLHFTEPRTILYFANIMLRIKCTWRLATGRFSSGLIFYDALQHFSAQFSIMRIRLVILFC